MLSTIRKWASKNTWPAFLNQDNEPVMNVEGKVQLANLDGELVDPASGGGGAGGGGNNTWSNAQGDFTAVTTDGTKNITITGLSWTFDWRHVVLGTILRKNSAGAWDPIDTNPVSVSGGVITLSDEDNFVSGDEVLVTLFGPDKAYNEATDGNTVEILNPNYSHNTSPEPLIAETNLGLDGVHDGGDAATDFEDSGETYTAAQVAEGYTIYNTDDNSSALIDIGGAGNPAAGDIAHAALAGGTDDDWDDGDVASIPERKLFVIPAVDFTLLTLHSKITAGANNIVWLKIYGTLFADADDQSMDDWVNLSLSILGNVNGITATAGTTLQDISSPPVPLAMLKYLVEIVGVATDGVQANAFDVKVMKASS